MGMFDTPEPFRDKFKEGEVFELQDAKLGKEINTDYGAGTPVLLKIAGKWYSIFGQGLSAQVERMESTDLPARVRLERVKTRSNQQVKVLVPANRPTPGEDDIPF